MAASSQGTNGKMGETCFIKVGNVAHADVTFAEEDGSAMEVIRTKDATISRLKKDLEVLMDENNLLHLELHDIQSTAYTTVSRIQADLTNLNRENVELKTRLKDIKVITSKLKHMLANNLINQVNVEPSVAKLDELALYKDVDQDSCPQVEPSGCSTDKTNIEVKMGTTHSVVDEDLSSVRAVQNLRRDDEDEKHPDVDSIKKEVTNNISEKLTTEEKGSDFEIISIQTESVDVKENLGVRVEDTQRTESSSPSSGSTEANQHPVQSVNSLRRSQRKSVLTRKQYSKDIDTTEQESPQQPPESVDLKAPEATPDTKTDGQMPSKSEEPKLVENNDTMDIPKQNGFNCPCGRQYVSKKRFCLHIWKCCIVRDLGEPLDKKNPSSVKTHDAEKNNMEIKIDIKRPRRASSTNLSSGNGISSKDNHISTEQETHTSKLANASNTIVMKVSSSKFIKSKEAQGDTAENSNVLGNPRHGVDSSKGGYFCICGTNFTTKGGLNVHVRYFTYDAKFACTHCERKFFSTCLLRAHMKSRHNVTFTGKDGCRKCGRCFQSRLKLYQHCKNVHKCGPLMANKKLKSPDPGPPVLEREDTQVEVGNNINIVDNGAVTLEIKPKKKLVANLSTSKGKRGPKPKFKNFKIMQQIKTKACKKTKSMAIGGSDIKENDNAFEKMPDLQTETNSETSTIAIKLENVAKDDDSRRVARKRKIPPKFKDNEFQILPSFFQSKKRQVSKMIQQSHQKIKTAAASSLKTKVGKRKAGDKVLHKITDGTLNGTEVKCMCEKVFTTKSALLSHVKLKTRGNVFKCNVCEEGFPRRDYLRRHLQIIHGKVGKFRLGRKIVSNKVKTKRAASVGKKHLVDLLSDPNFLNESQTSSKHGVAKCKNEIKCICGTSFKHKITLHEHLRLKIGRRVFKCEQCPQSFSRYDYFKEHLKRAHQVIIEGMACRDCGARGFPSHKELREHRVEFHSNKAMDAEAVTA